MSKRRPLVMGNWKLNGSREFTKELLTALKANVANVKGCDIAVATPNLYLAQASDLLKGSNIATGAENCDVHLKGAYTGDTSVEQLKDCGAKYVIIGHSERREYHKESDAFIAQKFAVIKEAGLTPVLCIGESEEENAKGLTNAVLAREIKAVVDHCGIDAFKGAVIAYEPIWAIGTGKSATPEQAQATHKFIREFLGEFSKEVADQVTLQYGGSVNDKNAEALFGQPDIDGALVGGASLKADAFTVIVKAAEKCKA